MEDSRSGNLNPIDWLGVLDTHLGLLPVKGAINSIDPKTSVLSLGEFTVSINQFMACLEGYCGPDCGKSESKICNLTKPHHLIFERAIQTNNIRNYLKKSFSNHKKKDIPYFLNVDKIKTVKKCHLLLKEPKLIRKHPFVTKELVDALGPPKTTLNITNVLTKVDNKSKEPIYDQRLTDRLIRTNELDIILNSSLYAEYLHAKLDRDVFATYDEKLVYPLVGTLWDRPDQTVLYFLSYYETKNPAKLGMDTVAALDNFLPENLEKFADLDEKLVDCQKMCLNRDKKNSVYLTKLLARPKNSSLVCVLYFVVFSKDILRSNMANLPIKQLYDVLKSGKWDFFWPTAKEGLVSWTLFHTGSSTADKKRPMSVFFSAISSAAVGFVAINGDNAVFASKDHTFSSDSLNQQSLEEYLWSFGDLDVSKVRCYPLDDNSAVLSIGEVDHTIDSCSLLAKTMEKVGLVPDEGFISSLVGTNYRGGEGLSESDKNDPDDKGDDDGGAMSKPEPKPQHSATNAAAEPKPALQPTPKIESAKASKSPVVAKNQKPALQPTPKIESAKASKSPIVTDVSGVASSVFPISKAILFGIVASIVITSGVLVSDQLLFDDENDDLESNAKVDEKTKDFQDPVMPTEPTHIDNEDLKEIDCVNIDTNKEKCTAHDLIFLPPDDLRFSVLSPDEIKLMWNPPTGMNSSDIGGYVIEQRHFSDTTIITVDSTSSDIDNLSLDDKYLFRVAATNPAGQVTTFSDWIEVTLSKPSPPYHLDGRVVSSDQISLSWGIQENMIPTLYVVERKSPGGEFTVISDDLAVANFEDANLKQGEHSYRVYAVNPIGKSDPSNKITELLLPLCVPGKFESHFPIPHNIKSKTTYSLLDAADIMVKIRNYADALIHYEAVLNKDCKSAESWVGAGNVLVHLGMIDIAKDYAKTAMAIEPNNTNALVVLGNAHLAEEEYDEAIDYYNQAKIAPDNSFALVGLCNVEIERKNYNMAIEYVEEITDNPDAYNCVANGHYKQKQFDDALTNYNKALSLPGQENNVDALLGSGLSMLILSSHNTSDYYSEKAKMSIKKIYDLSSDILYEVIREGDNLASANPTAAKLIWDTAYEIDPTISNEIPCRKAILDGDDMHLQIRTISDHSTKRHSYDTIVQEYRHASMICSESTSRNLESRIKLGTVLNEYASWELRIGNLDGSSHQYTAASKSFENILDTVEPGNADAELGLVNALYGLGSIKYQEGYYEDAIGIFEKILEYSPGHAGALDGIKDANIDKNQ